MSATPQVEAKDGLAVAVDRLRPHSPFREALDVRAAPACPPGPVAEPRSSRIICRQMWSASRRLRQRMASLWILPAAILVS